MLRFSLPILTLLSFVFIIVIIWGWYNKATNGPRITLSESQSTLGIKKSTLVLDGNEFPTSRFSCFNLMEKKLLLLEHPKA
jgi:hypothetical protein